jgi:hypothetical protein
MPGSSTTPSPPGARICASSGVAFHELNRVGTQVYVCFAAQWLAYVFPCQRFTDCLTTVRA